MPRKTQFSAIKFGIQPFSKGWQGVGQRPTVLNKGGCSMKFEMEQSSLAEMAGKVKKIASDSLPAEILRGVYLECDEEAL